MASTVKRMNLANIALASIVTEEQTPKSYYFATATSASVEPRLSEGAENILRVKNTILATNKTEDLVIGYTVTLSDNVLVPEILALVDGGSLVYDDVDQDKLIGYKAPAKGQVVSRTPFTLKLYAEDKGGDGETREVVEFVYKNCKGKPVNWSLTDGEFFVPEFVSDSTPNIGQGAVEINFLTNTEFATIKTAAGEAGNL